MKETMQTVSSGWLWLAVLLGLGGVGLLAWLEVNPTKKTIDELESV